MSRIAVYSCMVGANDVLPIFKKEDNIDYILFTDQDIKHPIWEVRRIPEEAYFNTKNDPRRISRFVKINPHKVLSDYDYTIYIDASIALRYEVMKYIMLLKDADIAIRKHPTRCCVYQEAQAVLHQGYDEPKSISWILNKMLNDKYPKFAGLTENGLIVRRMNKQNIKLSEYWWDLYLKGSRRDQLSCNYSIWKTKTKLEILPDNSIILFPHARHNRKIQ